LEKVGFEVYISEYNGTSSVVMYSLDNSFHDDLVAIKNRSTGEYITSGDTMCDEFEDMLDAEGIDDYENYEEVPLTYFIQDQLEDGHVLVIRENSNEGVRWMTANAIFISKNNIEFLNFEEVCSKLEAKMKGDKNAH
jgi:hypothetical protein